MEGFPYEVLPSGWFQVAFSNSVTCGEVVRLRYFGKDLVLYRDESGVARVVDAYCPHMGAHLGYDLGHGGRVEGECIVCPYHGWRWDHDGQCRKIPYSESPPPGKLLRTWPVTERSGAIYVWHDAAGAAPSWEVPGVPEFEREDFGTRFWHHTHMFRNLRFIPQVQIENFADLAHFKDIHGSAEYPELLKSEFDGPFLRVVLRNYYGSGRGSTVLGDRGYVVGDNALETWGLGVVVGRHQTVRDMIVLAGWTPIDEDHLDQFLQVAVPREEGDDPDNLPPIVQKLLDADTRQAEADHVIFEHMRYVTTPPFPPEEASGFARLRDWAAQFYAV